MFVNGGDCGSGLIKQGYTPAQTCFVDRARNRIDESLVRETHGCPDLAAMMATARSSLRLRALSSHLLIEWVALIRLRPLVQRQAVVQELSPWLE